MEPLDIGIPLGTVARRLLSSVTSVEGRQADANPIDLAAPFNVSIQGSTPTPACPRFRKQLTFHYKHSVK